VLAGARAGRRRRRRAVVIEPGQGQEVRGLEVASGEVFHRVTGSASVRQARDLARRLATGTGSLSRMRGTASAMTTAMTIARPTACAPAVAPGS
jgi:hypothetical protein